jgi:flagellar biosynthesis/type III secretory pathway ATPase
MGVVRQGVVGTVVGVGVVEVVVGEVMRVGEEEGEKEVVEMEEGVGVGEGVGVMRVEEGEEVGVGKEVGEREEGRHIHCWLGSSWIRGPS